MMKHVTKYFMQGLLFITPVAITIYVVYAIFVKVDGFFRFKTPGIGFLVTMVIVLAVGFMASNLITSRLVGLVDRLFARLPLLKMIYTSVKDLIGAFVGDKKGFNTPVYVNIVPGSDVRVLGFVTDRELGKFGLDGMVSVYLPQSYNFAGNLIIVPSSQVTQIKADSGELMAFIVSGGISKK